MKVKARLLDGSGPECSLERTNVRALVHPHNVGLVRQSAAQRSDAFSLGVERSLEVFDGQREVEDSHVTRGRACRRSGGP